MAGYNRQFDRWEEPDAHLITEVQGSRVSAFETADISVADHAFVGGVSQAIYVNVDATVVLKVGGVDAAWKLFAGLNPYRASHVIKTGTDVGVVVRGVY